jgi:hypothetical protein
MASLTTANVVTIQPIVVDGVVLSYHLTLVFASIAESERFADALPKSLRLDRNFYSNGEVTTGYLRTSGKVVADGANGGRNEAGIRRYRRIVAAARNAGLRVELADAKNFATVSEFESVAGL